MKHVELGIITKPQGLKGEFRVKSFEGTFEFFNNLSEIKINGKDYNVEKVVNRNTFYVLKVEEINDINQVETMRNFVVSADVEVDDTIAETFIDFKVISNNKEIGIVTEINNYGAGDVYTLNNGSMFAFVSGLLEKIDKENKIIYLNHERLNEVMV